MLPCDGRCEMAYVSGADEAVCANEKSAKRPASIRCQAKSHLVGRSVEDKKGGLPRVRDLQDAPAQVRFLSVEPLLESLGKFDLSGINWAIVGGESGPGARPMRTEWVISVRDQCREARVPFFFKQWGGVRKKKNGRMLDGRTYDEYPQRMLWPVPERTRCLEHAEEILSSFAKVFRGKPLVQLTA